MRDPNAADFKAVRVVLFQHAADDRNVFAWYIGPAELVADGTAYLPASANTIASVAILRAIALAEAIGTEICVIDAHDLWSQAWEP